MTTPRVTLRGLMFTVALVALNLFLIRVAVPEGREAILLTGLPLLLLNIALLLGMWRTRPGRAFWFGYLVLGGMVTGSWVLMLARPYVRVPSPDSALGTVPVKTACHVAWEVVLITPLAAFADAWRDAFGQRPRLIWQCVAYTSFMSLHVGSGLLGGLIARRLGRRFAGSQLSVEPTTTRCR